MEQALIVCGNPANAAVLSGLLKELGIQQAEVCATGGEARRRLSVAEPALILISAPLSDEFGVELALDLEEGGDASVVMLVSGELFEDVQGKLEPVGVLCLTKPINRKLLSESLRAILSVRRSIYRLREQNRVLTQKLEDAKLIGRAKCCLMEVLGMSEEDAHRYMQKQAMDMRMTQRAIAENIVRTYEP